MFSCHTCTWFKDISCVGDDLDMNTVTFLGDLCPFPTAESREMRLCKYQQKKLGW